MRLAALVVFLSLVAPSAHAASGDPRPRRGAAASPARAACAAYGAAMKPLLTELSSRRDTLKKDLDDHPVEALTAFAGYLSDRAKELSGWKIDHPPLATAHAILPAALADLAQSYTDAARALAALDESALVAALEAIATRTTAVQLALTATETLCRATP